MPLYMLYWWFIMVVNYSESRCIAWVIASRGTWWLCFATGFARYSWSLLTPRWLGAARIIERRKVLVSGSDRGNCEGFLTFPRRRAKIYSSGLLMAYGSPSCVSCAAPDCGLGVWGLLAREPPSGWIATAGTSLPTSMWTLEKNHCVIIIFGISCDWLIISCHGGITHYLSCVFTFLV